MGRPRGATFLYSRCETPHHAKNYPSRLIFKSARLKQQARRNQKRKRRVSAHFSNLSHGEDLADESSFPKTYFLSLCFQIFLEFLCLETQLSQPHRIPTQIETLLMPRRLNQPLRAQRRSQKRPQKRAARKCAENFSGTPEATLKVMVF